MSFSTRYRSINLGQKYENMFLSWLQKGHIPDNEVKFFDVVMIGYSADRLGLDKMLISCPITLKKMYSHYYFQEFLLGLTLTIKIGNGAWMPKVGQYPKITAHDDLLEIPLCDPSKAFSNWLLGEVRKAVSAKKV